MIFYNASKDEKKPATLAIKDRVDDKDIIALSECLWMMTETKISIIGLLSPFSIGIEDFSNKSWKPNGEKVAFSFHRDELPVWDKDKKENVIEPTTAEQKVQFQVLHRALTELEVKQKAVCASAVLKPKVSALMIDNVNAEAEDAKNYFQFVTKSMFVFDPREPDKLTGDDTDFIKALVQQKPGDKKSGGGGNWNSRPQETEAERIQARWTFVHSQFAKVFTEEKLESVADILVFIDAQPENIKFVYRDAFAAVISLASGK